MQLNLAATGHHAQRSSCGLLALERQTPIRESARASRWQAAMKLAFVDIPRRALMPPPPVW